MPQYIIVGYSERGYLVACDGCSKTYSHTGSRNDFKCPVCEPKPRRGRKPKKEEA